MIRFILALLSFLWDTYEKIALIGFIPCAVCLYGLARELEKRK